MNVFYLDTCAKISAQSLIDIHVRKMIVESSQLLANCYSNEELYLAPRTQSGTIRKYSYYNHPCSVWVRSSYDNFSWLLNHACFLLDEFDYRFEKKHFCDSFIGWCYNHRPNLKRIGFTKPALAVKHYPHFDDPVLTYRNYYSNDKRTDKNGKRIDYYTKRNRPEWFVAKDY